MLKFIEKLVYSAWTPTVSKSVKSMDLFQTRTNKLTGRVQSRRVDVNQGRITSSHPIVK